MDAARIGAVFVANAAAGLIQGQEMIRGEVLLQGTPLAGQAGHQRRKRLRVFVDRRSTLPPPRWRSGQVDAAIAIGVEQMSHPDRRRTFGALASATDTVRRRDMFALVDDFALRARDGDDSALTSSPLMEHYAEQGAQVPRAEPAAPPRTSPGSSRRTGSTAA